MEFVISLIKRILIYGFVGLIVGVVIGFFVGMQLEYAWEDTAFYDWLDSIADTYGLFAEEYAPIFFAEIFAVIGVVLAIITTIYEARKKKGIR